MPETCPTRTPPDVRGSEPLREPVIQYPHARDGQTIGISVIGGYIYDGAIDALDGKYVFGDYSKEGAPRGSLFAATPTQQGLWDVEQLQVEGAEGGAVEGYLIAIARDAEGELFALTSAGDLGGSVNRITATEATETATTATGANTTVTSTTTGADTTANATTTAARTRTETTAASGMRTEMTGGAGTGTAGGEAASASTTNESGATNETTTSGDGAGFGILAALAAVGGLAARRLARGE